MGVKRENIFSLAQERYGTEPEYLFAKYPGFAVLRHPNKKWYGVIMDLPRRRSFTWKPDHAAMPQTIALGDGNVFCDYRL